MSSGHRYSGGQGGQDGGHRYRGTSYGGNPGDRTPYGGVPGDRNPYTNNNNAIYGSGNAVYGHGHGHHGKGSQTQPSEYSQGHYGQGAYIYGGSAVPGPASRLAREISAETMSASSGSVNARRRNNRGTLEQVNEGESTDSRGEGEEESRSLTRRNERARTNSRLERGSVKSREISVRRGSVVSQRHEQSSTRPGSRLAGGGTYNRAPDRKSTSPTFSGDETDKDFHF